MEMVVVLCYFCVYISGWRARVAVWWKRYAGVPVPCRWEELTAAGGCSGAGFSSSMPRLLGTQTGAGLVTELPLQTK